MFAQLVNVFKLRIGLLIAITAMAGYAVTPGTVLSLGEVLLLGLAVLISSASAGAFNQYVEHDLDAHMSRTRSRPFVTGAFKPGQLWLWIIASLTILSVAMAAWLFNVMVAFYTFMGAFFYAIVYTVWLKRRSSMNIVIGGLSGSFAVLAGAAAADPGLSASSILLAAVLFLWTPPHFWSLAIVLHKDYKSAGVPMLPVVVGDKKASQIIFINTFLLVLISWLPLIYGWGFGMFYQAGAIVGGIIFLYKNYLMLYDQSRKAAMGTFFASLIQLSLILAGTMIDAMIA